MAAVELFPSLEYLKRRTNSVNVDDDARTASAAAAASPANVLLSLTKKLKRMPHLFDRVLELPFHADTVVEVQESRDCFTFLVRDIIQPALFAEEVKAELVEIVPGAIKVVVVGGAERLMSDLESSSDQVEFWRFRLPASTIPAGTVARYENEVLQVTIPKNPVSCAQEEVDLKKDKDAAAESSLLTVEDGNTRTRQQQGVNSESSDDYCIDYYPSVTPSSGKRVQSDYSANREGDYPMSRIQGQETTSSSLDTDLQELQWQRDLFEDLESFGSPRRVRDRSSCTKAAQGSHQDAALGSPDFLHNILGSWVQGFAIFV